MDKKDKGRDKERERQIETEKLNRQNEKKQRKDWSHFKIQSVGEREREREREREIGEREKRPKMKERYNEYKGEKIRKWKKESVFVFERTREMEILWNKQKRKESLYILKQKIKTQREKVENRNKEREKWKSFATWSHKNEVKKERVCANENTKTR